MPISDASWSAKLRTIGDLERPDHWHLRAEDDCTYFGDYTPRAGYGHSATNQLIQNLKKKPELRHTAQWPHKQRAIREVGQAIAANVNQGALGNVVFVPIPPSWPPGDPGYDDRMAQVAQAVGPGAIVRELLFTSAAREAQHLGQQRRDPDILRATLGFRTELAAGLPSQIVLLDDVLTTGCSFVVCKSLLQEHIPNAQIYGLFVARRIIPNPFAGMDFDDLDI